jgi:hypothetical protein
LAVAVAVAHETILREAEEMVVVRLEALIIILVIMVLPIPVVVVAVPEEEVKQAVQVAPLVAVELAARSLSNQVAAEARTSAR